MRTTFLTVCLVLSFVSLTSQNLEVEGTAKIKQMDPATSSAQPVMKEDDGTLTIASAMSSPSYSIGDIAQGGVIFWMSTDGKMGKVVYPNFVTRGAWSNVTSTEIGHAAQNLNDGVLNTYAIINQAGHNESMALICTHLEYGGFSDWYLPSENETLNLFSARSTINPILASINGDQTWVDFTWVITSTEVDFDSARAITNTGVRQTWNKGGSAFPSHAIRTFFVD